jgi:DNA-binding YbaB/EbfC family protein
MAKRSFRGRPKKKKTQSADSMMSQFQKMQQDMAAAQAALEQEMITVTAGGGAISIVISGHQRVQSIEVDPDLLDPQEAEMLQDMLVAGINSAIEQSQALSAEKLEGATGDMGGLSDMLGGLGLG